MASFETMLARRYLRPTREGAFVAVMVGFAAVGTAVGVFAIVVCMALMNGFRAEIQNTLFSASAHFSVTGPLGGDVPGSEGMARRIRAMPGVAGASPMRLEKGLLRGRPGSPPEGVVVKAVDPQSAASTSSIFASLRPIAVERLQEGEILVGQELAERLDLALGDQVTIAFLRAELGLSGLQPKFAAFRVAGTFQSRISEYDRNWVFIALEEGKRIARAEDAEMIEVRTSDIDRIDPVKRQVMAALGGGLGSSDLRETNRQLFQALQVEKWIFTGVLCLIVLVAAFNIVASLVLLVTQKRRDIGTLLSLGATPGQIRRAFILQGLWISGTGTALGLLKALPTVYLLDRYKVIHLPPSVYDFLTYVPFRISFWEVALAAAFPMLIAFLAALYPATKASRLDPVETLRSE